MSTPASDRSAPLASLGERGLIALIRDRFPASPALLPVGIGDDAAVSIPARGELEVLTTDAMVEGVHFDLALSSFADVGYKALAVNVSDIAAMGATSRLALLSLILPEHMTVGQIEEFLDGLADITKEASITLAGGNITRSPGPFVVDIMLTGSVRPRKILTRSGGRAGDGLYLTGAVGAAAAGLGWLKEHAGLRANSLEDPGLAACVERYRRPAPRFRLGAIAGRTRAASACMDLSDGLADAVSQLAASGGTGATIEAAALPIPEAARRWFASQGIDPVCGAISGGDDYELLFSVPPKRLNRFKAAVRQSRGLTVTRIGELTPSRSVGLLRDGVISPLPGGFTHF